MSMTQPVARRQRIDRQRRCEYMQHDNQLWTREAAAQQKVTRGGGTRQQAVRHPAGEQEANRKRGARGQEAMEPRWALRSGGRVERMRGGGIDATTIPRTRDFCGGSESDGDGDGNGNGNGDGKCRAPLSQNLAVTALVLTAEAAAALIADDADGGNNGVTIVGRASLAAGGGRIINYIVYLLLTL